MIVLMMTYVYVPVYMYMCSSAFSFYYGDTGFIRESNQPKYFASNIMSFMTCKLKQAGLRTAEGHHVPLRMLDNYFRAAIG